jgi:hypothetical protein
MSLVTKTGGCFEKGRNYQFGNVNIVMYEDNLTISRLRWSTHRINFDSSFIIRSTELLSGLDNENYGFLLGKSLFFFLAILDDCMADCMNDNYHRVFDEHPKDSLALWAIGQRCKAFVYKSRSNGFKYHSGNDYLTELTGGRWEKESDLYFLGVAFRTGIKVSVYDTVAALHRQWFGKDWERKSTQVISIPVVSPAPLPSKTRAEVLADQKIAAAAERIMKSVEHAGGFSVQVDLSSEIVEKIKSVLVLNGFSVTDKTQTNGRSKIKVSCL